MGLFDQWGYTNFHELNLDWVLQALKELEHTIEQFVAINALKYADPIQWDITSQYEKNTIVIDPQSGTAYISTQAVPAGVALTDTNYWSVVFDLEQFVTKANGNFTPRVETQTTTTATFATPKGKLVVWGGDLYEALVNITAGDQYVIDSNIKRVTVEGIVGSRDDLTTTDKSNLVAAINELVVILTAAVSNIGDLASLTTTDKSNLVNAINEIVVILTSAVNDIGDIANLTTTDKSNLVNAINEVLTTLTSTTGDLASLTTNDKSNLVAAINEVNSTGGGAIAKIGNLNDLTTTDKSNVVAAINEVNGALANLSDYRIINVLDYGATGDGITDDTAAVNRAINALNDSSDIRKALYFPSGSYLVGDLTTLNTSCVVFGAGANATRITPKADTTRIFEITQHCTEIKNLLFYDSNNTTALCIYAELGNGISIHDIKLENVYKFIVCGNTLGSTQDSYYAEIYSIFGVLRHEFMICNGCKSFIDVHDISINSEISYEAAAIAIEPIGAYIDTVKLSNVSIQRYFAAIYIGTTTTTNQLVSNIWINNCVFDGIGSRGIFINVPNGTTADVRSVFISDTWIAMTGNAYNCITLQNLSATATIANVFINNCTLIAPKTDTNSSCIEGMNVKDLLVEGCELIEYNRCGIALGNSEKITINDNEIGYLSFAPSLGNTNYGLILNNNTKMLVTGNNLINNHTAGVSESGNSNYRIENNLGGADTGDNYAIGEVKYRNGGYKYWNGSAWI